MRRYLLAASLLAGSVADPAPAAALQFYGRTELVATSGYLWRGITRHRSPVGQLFGTAGRAGAKLDLELSAWASAVTGGCDRSVCPEGTGARLADVNASLLAGLHVRNTRVALGANVYRFESAPYRPGFSATTVEAVLSVHASPTRHIQVALTGWMDLDDVDGLYAELTATLPVTLSTGHPPRVFFTATLGRNQGQNTTDDGVPAAGYYVKNGFTHVALELDYLFLRPGVAESGMSLQLFARVQGNFDQATKPSVWPFARSSAEQQVVAGFVLGPLLSHRAKPKPGSP